MIIKNKENRTKLALSEGGSREAKLRIVRFFSSRVANTYCILIAPVAEQVYTQACCMPRSNDSRNTTNTTQRPSDKGL